MVRAPPEWCWRAAARRAWARRRRALEWHGSTLLRRHGGVARAARSTARSSSSRAPGQELPALPAGVEVVEDPVEGVGPDAGPRGRPGRGASTGRSTAFVCSTDMPFLHPAFVARGAARVRTDDVDVVLPFARGFRQPLAAAYRTGLAELVTSLIAQRAQLRPGMLFEHCRSRRLDDDALLADPGRRPARPGPRLGPQPQRARRLRRRPARPPAEVAVQCFGALAGAGRRGHADRRRRPRSAPRRQALGLELDRHVVAALNGDRITRDPAAAPGRRRLGGVPVGGRGGLTRPRLQSPDGGGRVLRAGAGRRRRRQHGHRHAAAPVRRGAARLPRRGRARHLAAAPARPAGRRPAGAGGAAGVRVLPARRHPADHEREVRRRREVAADRACSPTRWRRAASRSPASSPATTPS